MSDARSRTSAEKKSVSRIVQENPAILLAMQQPRGNNGERLL